MGLRDNTVVVVLALPKRCMSSSRTSSRQVVKGKPLVLCSGRCLANCHQFHRLKTQDLLCCGFLRSATATIAELRRTFLAKGDSPGVERIAMGRITKDLIAEKNGKSNSLNTNHADDNQNAKSAFQR